MKKFTREINNWVKTEPSHYLYGYWKMYDSDVFLYTSCEITALGIRLLFSNEKEWICLENPPSFDEMKRKYPVFQVSFGEDWTDLDHILTVFKDEIIQSFFNRYEITQTPITQKIVNAFDELTDDSFEIITKVKNNKTNIFYWVPEQ